MLADVIPRHVGVLQDAAELLKFAAANGFLLAAGAGLVRSFFSSYRQIRQQLGLLQFEEAEILEVLGASGIRRPSPPTQHGPQHSAHDFSWRPCAGPAEISRAGARRKPVHASSATVFDSTPMPDTSTSTTSPGTSHLGGSKRAPAPFGVPVRITSPGSNVVKVER